MLNNVLSAHNTSQGFRHLSPQALDALHTLEMLRNNKIVSPITNPKIVRRVSSQYYQPQPFTIYGGRSASVFTASPIKLVPMTENSHLISIGGSILQPLLQHQQPQKLPTPTHSAQKGKQFPTEESKKQGFVTDRLCSQQNTLGKLDEPTPFFRDTVSSDRNRCNQTSLSAYLAKHQLQQQIKTHTQSSNNQPSERLHELQAFKQQVQNDLLMETIISKFETPSSSFKKNSPFPKCTPVTTPIVNSLIQGTQPLSPADEQLDSQLRSQEEVKERFKMDKENANAQADRKLDQQPPLTPKTNLMQKKRQILNQILALDNQIKIMQDEETRKALDPANKLVNKQSASVPCVQNQSSSTANTTSAKMTKGEMLYRQGQESRQNLRRMFEKTVTSKIVKEMKECTFVPKVNSNKQISSTFFDRMNKWVKRKSEKRALKQEENNEELLRQCTFSPVSKGNMSSSKQVNTSDVYQRNVIWQQKVNMKKQKLKQNNTVILSNQKRNSNPGASVNVGSQKKINRTMSQRLQQYQIDFSNLLKADKKAPELFDTDLKQKKHSTTEVPTSLSPQKQRDQSVDVIDQKYQRICEIAQRIQIRAQFKQKC